MIRGQLLAFSSSAESWLLVEPDRHLDDVTVQDPVVIPRRAAFMTVLVQTLFAVVGNIEERRRFANGVKVWVG